MRARKKDSLVSRDHHFNALLMEIKHAFTSGEKLFGKKRVAETAGMLKDTTHGWCNLRLTRLAGY